MSLSIVRKLGDMGWEAHYDLPPREAVRAAYAQFKMGDYETWKYVQYEPLVQEGHFTFSCGDFVTLKTGQKPTTKEIKEYVKSIRNR